MSRNINVLRRGKRVDAWNDSRSCSYAAAVGRATRERGGSHVVDVSPTRFGDRAGREVASLVVVPAPFQGGADRTRAEAVRACGTSKEDERRGTVIHAVLGAALGRTGELPV